MNASTPKVSVGFTTIAGALSTIAAAGGAVYAAVKANDTATITAGVATILTALATLGGRFAQAVAVIRKAAPVAQGFIGGASGVTTSGASGLNVGWLPGRGVDQQSGDEAELVSDEDEFASPPPDETNTPVQPSQVGLTNDPEA